MILEEAIPGFEVGCAVMGREELTVGLVDEIQLTGGVFDFEEKYTLKTSTIYCPARISPKKVNTIPGFTAHSRYPNMMKGIGMDFTALISHLIELGVGK